jgi:hypothetical protein
MQTIQLTISLEEANLILDALGQQPFRSVYELIGKIQQQANEQLADDEAGNSEPSSENSPQVPSGE